MTSLSNRYRRTPLQLENTVDYQNKLVNGNNRMYQISDKQNSILYDQMIQFSSILTFNFHREYDIIFRYKHEIITGQ